MTQNFGQAAQKATSAVKNYFTPEYNAGKNFWSTPTAQRLGDVQQTVQKYTAPIVNRVKSTAGKVKSWFSNLFK